MVTILGIYLYLEGTFYQKDLYIQKGETFLKITYCQDIRAISVNVKRYILKEAFPNTALFSKTFYGGQNTSLLSQIPPFCRN